MGIYSVLAFPAIIYVAVALVVMSARFPGALKFAPKMSYPEGLYLVTRKTKTSFRGKAIFLAFVLPGLLYMSIGFFLSNTIWVILLALISGSLFALDSNRRYNFIVSFYNDKSSSRTTVYFDRNIGFVRAFERQFPDSTPEGISRDDNFWIFFTRIGLAICLGSFMNLAYLWTIIGRT